MWIYLLYRHLLSTCYIPDTGLSTKVTDERPSSLIMLHSLNKFSDRSNRGCLGDVEDCHLFQTKGFLEELRSELSFEEWIEVRRKHRKWGEEKCSVRRRNCGGASEGRAYFKACAWFYITRAEGLGKTRER